jgi:hypothetical protein
MEFFMRLRRTAFLVLCSLFPSLFTSLYCSEEDGNTPNHCMNETISLAIKKFPGVLRTPAASVGPDGFLRIFFPCVFPLAAPFLLYRLKRTGFSGCRVTVTDGGLLVTARR